MILAKISDKCFEAAGVFFGLLASATIATQVYAEYRTDNPSTLSLVYTAGFLIIFAFWAIYGIRFNRVALWLTNGIAACMQALLLATILLK
jgi:uncharacterized protein with PQ loop repeat